MIHEKSCKDKQKKTSLIKPNFIRQYSVKQRDVCHRCGRQGHTINDCYAKTTVSRRSFSDDSDDDRD